MSGYSLPIFCLRSSSLIVIAVGFCLMALAAEQPKPASDSAAVTLLPFEVTADKQDSYEALNFSSLSGTNRSLDKLPVTAEIFNATMIADLGVTDMFTLLNQYATGVGAGENSGGSSTASGTQDGDRQAGSISAYRVRGLNVGAPRRNGITGIGFLGEGYSYDRVEIVRGPQSLLFGSSPAGGVINFVTKKAAFNSNYFRPQVRVDQYGSERHQVDANVGRNFFDRKFALRVTAMEDNTNFWRENLRHKNRGIYADVVSELIPSSATTLRFSAERTVGEAIEPVSRSLVSGIPNIVANNTPLALLLARNDPALALIDNGKITWENVDSLAGNSNATVWRQYFYTATLSTRFSSWLNGQVVAAREMESRDQLTTGNALRAPLTGGNPLNAWAVGQNLSGATIINRQDAIRALLTADFQGSRFTKNNLVLGSEIRNTPQSWNFTRGFFQVNNAGSFVVNPANINDAVGGRTSMPTQWVNVENNLPGFVTSTTQKSFTSNGITYVRDESKHQNPALVATGNPFGYNAGPAGAGMTQQHAVGTFAVLNTTWFDGRLETLAGARRDELTLKQLSTGLGATAKGVTGNLGFVWNFSKPVALYAGWSTTFLPGSFNFLVDTNGNLMPNGKGDGREAGFKLNALEGRISGSVTYFTTTSSNESLVIPSTALSAVDPKGINGAHFLDPGHTAYNFARKSSGYEATITAQPIRNLRLQFGYSHLEGKISSNYDLPLLYNDQFKTDSQGRVLLADGSPLMVPVNPATPVATDGKTYAAGVATEAMTVAILKNGDANGNRKASLDPANGLILNAPAVGLNVPGVGTGVTGLPIAQHQLGFTPPGGSSLAVLRGGDRTPGYPTNAFTLTSMYTLSEGRFKGLGFGLNGTLNYNMLLYYYTDVAAGGARKAFIAPNKATANLIFSYQHKITKKIGWKTQFNLNNIADRKDITIYPLITTGVPDNATYRQSPRMWVWTNTFDF